MRAIKRFLITVLIVLVIAGGVGAYLYFQHGGFSLDKMPEPVRRVLEHKEALPPARTPQTYHILEDQGGVPREEAERAGLSGDGYAYFSALTPIQCAKAVEQCQGVVVRGKTYDMCWRFNTEPGETQVLEFNTGGNYDELHFGCGFEDTHPSDPTGNLAVELSVLADGQEVFSPRQLTPDDTPLFGMAEITGAQRVTVILRRIGRRNTLAPVLLDPFMRTKLDQPRPEE